MHGIESLASYCLLHSANACARIALIFSDANAHVAEILSNRSTLGAERAGHVFDG